MADNASIARPYAKAVFDLATETNQHDDWTNALDALAAIANDDDFVDVAASPQIKAEQLEKLVIDIVGDKLPNGGENFVKLLAQNDRLEALPGVQQQYSLLLAESRKSIEAEVLTARPLSDDQKTKLTEALQTRLGVTVSITETVDESLVGGAIVKAGDLVIDGSAKGRVEKLAIALT